jgi:hypothetical protein
MLIDYGSAVQEGERTKFNGLLTFLSPGTYCKNKCVLPSKGI